MSPLCYHFTTNSENDYGAKVLSFEKGHSLAFEWTMPPFVAELNTQPLPTWIEIEFEPAGKKTHVSIVHYGFATSEQWDRAYHWFQTEAWPSVVARLTQFCNEKIDPWVTPAHQD